jgi:CxxC motif-containing protein
VFAVNLPRFRHKERRCVEAKEVELDKFDEFEAYEEVGDIGQKALGTNWVLVEKVKEGKSVVKARLTVRGDQEDTEGVRTDSPTVKKSNINIMLMVAARQGWKVKSSDITSAFLQSVPIDRDVFVRPPRQRRIPGVLWKLKKTVYGLNDASRGFYLSFSQTILDLGCERSRLDPAMFLFFKKGEQEEEIREPKGIALTHVDDILHAGESSFNKTVMDPLK